MKGKKGKVLFLLALIFSLFLMSGSVQAATKKGWVQTGTHYVYYNDAGRLAIGWHTIDGHDYYFRIKAQGKAPIGSRVTGFYKIGSSTFFFNKDGELHPAGKPSTETTIFSGKMEGLVFAVECIRDFARQIPITIFCFRKMER